MRSNGSAFVYTAIESGRLQCRRIVMACAMLAAGRTAWAQDEHSTPINPAAFAPLEKLIVAICVIVLVGAVWYHLRKQALLREIQAQTQRDHPRDRD